MVFRVLRPDSMTVWQNEEILKRFSKYRGIIDGTRLARYLIAKSIKCDFDLSEPVEKLEIQLREKSQEFKKVLNEDSDILKDRAVQQINYITLAETIAINTDTKEHGRINMPRFPYFAPKIRLYITVLSIKPLYHLNL